jgi:hypothetical protein
LTKSFKAWLKINLITRAEIRRNPIPESSLKCHIPLVALSDVKNPKIKSVADIDLHGLT